MKKGSANPCSVKSALVQKYHDALIAHSATVVKLQKMISSNDDFTEAYRRSKEAKKDVVAAGEALRRHIADHGC
jgi:hypothetical protein